MRRSSTLHLYLVRSFLPSFLAATALFSLLLELIDLFGNLWRYLALDASVPAVLTVMLYYLPTALSNTLPISVLFAAAFSLGRLYADNELTVVFGSGVSLTQFLAPLILVGAILSASSFAFDDAVVLPTIRQKNRLSRELLRQGISLSNPDVAVIAKDGRIVYRAEYYDDAGQSLTGVTILERNPGGAPIARTEAATGRWDGSRWILGRVRRFELAPDGTWKDTSYGSWTDESLDEGPEAFRRQNKDLRELSVGELSGYVAFLRRAGLPFAQALAERHKRFAFAFTPLVVVLIAGALGGRFRKNVLLMSLLSSLLAATGYYVAQMISMLLAKTGIIQPWAGAWSPLIIFAAVGIVLFRLART
jgi:lipopolysaccharide export system permease protein